MANAKVEAAVLVAQRWIVASQTRLRPRASQTRLRRDARLRNRRFFSIEEINAAIRPLLDEINARVMRAYGASRADLFAMLDRPALSPAPDEPCVFARWSRPPSRNWASPPTTTSRSRASSTPCRSA